VQGDKGVIIIGGESSLVGSQVAMMWPQTSESLVVEWGKRRWRGGAQGDRTGGSSWELLSRNNHVSIVMLNGLCLPFDAMMRYCCLKCCRLDFEGMKASQRGRKPITW